MTFFDTHAHLDDEQLSAELDHWMKLAKENDVTNITAIATTAATSHACLAVAKKYQGVFASVGIHPNKCQEADDADWAQVCELAGKPEAVAIGETGLDLYWDYCPIETQKIWFKRHIELSQETGKPLVIHMRDCEQEILDALAPFAKLQPINGIMHSFCGTWETAEQCLEWGMHISFAGMVTFKKSEELREIAAKVPLNRLLVETDSPYLTPHPYRGKRPNHPAMVRHTAQCLADVLGMPVSEFGEATSKNAKRIFNIES